MTQTQFEVLPLFSLPVYINTLDGVSSEEVDLVKSLQYNNIVNGGPGLLSTNKNVLDLPQFSNIKLLVENEVKFFVHNILNLDERIDVYIKSSWSLKHRQQDFSDVHIHSNSFLSGILYLIVDENTGALILQKFEGSSLNCVSLDFLVKSCNLLNAKAWKILPKPKQLILFPSTLLHSSEKNFSNSDRYCISFDVFLKGTLSPNNNLSILNLK